MKKAISVFVLSGILASSSIAQTKSTSEVNLSNKKTNKMTNSKEAANNAFLALFKDYSEEGVKKYISSDFIQHNPFVPTGREALIGFFARIETIGY